MTHTFKLSALTLAGFGALVAANNAAALPALPFDSSIRFDFSGWTQATTVYSTDCGKPNGAPVLGPANGDGVDCDNKTVISSASPYTFNPPNAGGVAAFEDSWGLGDVTQIESPIGSAIYTSTTGLGEHITAFFWGLVDGQVDVGAVTTTTVSYGGRLQLWVTNPGSPEPIPTAPKPSDRTGVSSFSGVTGSNLLLDLNFAPGVNSFIDNANLIGSNTNNQTNFSGGSGALFDVVGGIWAPYLNSNTILGADGLYHDLSLTVNYQCSSANIAGGVCNPANTNPNNIFSLLGSGFFTGQTVSVIPEIDAMAGTGALVFLSGLLALVGESRKRKS